MILDSFKGLILFKKIIPPFFFKIYHFLVAFLAAVFFGFPSRKIKVIGITGTNGKSTVVDFSTRIFEEAGFKVSSISSIRFKMGAQEWPNKTKMTMPGRFVIQKFIFQSYRSGCQYFILEVTSQGIEQFRHKFINFEAAVFTNLSPEHIEAHGSFENYKKAKAKLFKAAKKVHIINLDDENSQYFLKIGAKKIYGYSAQNTLFTSKIDKIIRAREIEQNQEGIKFLIKKTLFSLKILGNYNIYNALAAICVAESQGIDLKTCKKALEKILNIPGRMEVVINSPFKAIIDYAVTPDSLEKAYKTVREIFSPARLICVLGACGGGRDKWKRPVLGEIASKYCDIIILTNEDPYDEDPEEIIRQIAVNCQKNSKKIINRREAIKEAIRIAQKNDAIIITGKGCEPWICLANGKKMPWDDREVVREEFKKLR